MATYIRSAVNIGSVRCSMEDQRSDAIRLTWTAIILETRIQRYKHYSFHRRVEYRIQYYTRYHTRYIMI
jgi:hypothetical protein